MTGATATVFPESAVKYATKCGFWGCLRGQAVSPESVYFYHSVTDSDVGLDVLRRVRKRGYLFSQGCHKYSQRADVTFPCRFPYAARDEGMCQHFSDVFCKKT